MVDLEKISEEIKVDENDVKSIELILKVSFKNKEPKEIIISKDPLKIACSLGTNILASCCANMIRVNYMKKLEVKHKREKRIKKNIKNKKKEIDKNEK